jgi:hypothetical protein
MARGAREAGLVTPERTAQQQDPHQEKPPPDQRPQHRAIEAGQQISAERTPRHAGQHQAEEDLAVEVAEPGMGDA